LEERNKRLIDKLEDLMELQEYINVSGGFENFLKDYTSNRSNKMDNYELLERKHLELERDYYIQEKKIAILEKEYNNLRGRFIHLQR
jgi:hypothetical protein